jgi:hypothetical protein
MKGVPEQITMDRIDLDTVRFHLDLEPGQESAFDYTVTTHHGRRAQQVRR